MKSKKEIEAYKNDFNRENYDRVNIVIPKGRKEIWKEYSKLQRISLNALVYKAVEDYIDRLATDKTGQM